MTCLGSMLGKGHSLPGLSVGARGKTRKTQVLNKCFDIQFFVDLCCLSERNLWFLFRSVFPSHPRNLQCYVRLCHELSSFFFSTFYHC